MANIEGIEVKNLPIESNMVFFDLEETIFGSTTVFTNQLESHKIKIGSIGKQTLQAVTHLDATGEQMVIQVVKAIQCCIEI